MLEDLKEAVLRANLRLVSSGLVILTWGNASQISGDGRFVVIKPSGVSYSDMRAEDMVVTDLDGNVVEGGLRPSSDLPTHLELYRSFPGIGGVVHTHSRYATAFAQSERGIPCYGTTHADTFYGEVPCTRPLSSLETLSEYERNTGRVISETFRTSGTDYMAVPAVLVCKHGPFTWGSSADKAVENAIILEEVACMALAAKELNAEVAPAPQYLVDKHYLRKHGKNAYYGQK